MCKENDVLGSFGGVAGMIFYEMTIQSQPKIEFACSVTTENYRNIVDRRANMIEISMLEGVPITTEAQLRRVWIT